MVNIENMINVTTLASLYTALGTFAAFVFAAFYVYVSLALMAIAKKTKTKNAWFAWIPIANYYLITQASGVSGLWTFALLFGVIPVVGGLVTLGVTIWLFWRISKRMKFPAWISLLLIVPFVNLVVLGILAWYKK